MNIHQLHDLVGKRFRSRRMRAFAEKLRPVNGTTILDLGGYPWTWANFPLRPLVTTLNLHAVEFIQTPDLPPIRVTVGNACQLDHPDGSFEIVFSNSVIEHLGTYENQQAFAREARRVGRSLWIQTPAREYFLEPHLLAPFVHYFPHSVQRRLIRYFTLWGLMTKPSPAQIEGFLQEVRLLSFAEMKELFPDCHIHRETTLGFTKSYVAVRKGT